MRMWYFVSDDVSAVVQAAQIKNVLPRPMGVGVGFVNKPDDAGFMGYTNYFNVENNIISPLATGYTSYADYDTKEGRFLSYRNIS